MREIWNAIWRNLFVKTFNYRGRTSRKEYFICSIFWWLLFAVDMMLIFGIKDCHAVEFCVRMVCLYLQVIPFTALRVRRMHDIGKTGWALVWPYAIIVVSSSSLTFLLAGYLFLARYMYDKSK